MFVSLAFIIMGSGASALSTQQSTELTRLMKEEMAKHEGKSDDEIREVMIPQYNSFLAEVMVKYPTALPKGKSGKQSRPVRRRSYGEDPEKKVDPTLAASQSVPGIEGAIATAAAAANADEVPPESMYFPCSVPSVYLWR